MNSNETNQPPKFIVVGGGLAGTEAAWQLARAGHDVQLFEMRPIKMTAAHQTHDLAELVCSNSLKSLSEHSAPGLLKQEMTALDSLIIRSGFEARVPAGQALAVDRNKFSEAIRSSLESLPNFKKASAEIVSIPSEQELKDRNEYWIVATGPLTSEGLSKNLRALAGDESNLYFYDAIAPILDSDSINFEEGFFAGRYENQDADYFNIPLTKEQYQEFVSDVATAEKMPLHEFEQPKYFESCLPIEVMIERGEDTLRFGPMKPVGLTDPKTGRWPYAAIQLRAENNDKTMFSLVGFQTKMKWPEQKRVFSKLPCLKNVEFFRYGSVHRNTYLNSPKCLNSDLSFKSNARVFLAGQITGVEGYTESAAIGLLAGRAAHAKATNRFFVAPPEQTALGSLIKYVTKGVAGPFQPMNTNFGLLPPVEKRKHEGKESRHIRVCEIAREAFTTWMAQP